MPREPLPRRRFGAAAAALLALAALALFQHAEAQDKFPSRPVTLVVPLATGGPSDILARRFAQPLSAALGVPVVVVNVPGAGGAIGTRRVIDAAPDGYTVLVANSGLASAPTILNRPDLDPREKLEALGMFGVTPVTLSVRPDLPVANLRDFIQYAHGRGDQLNMAHAGNGSGSHLNSLLFNSLAKLTPTYVPYQGAGPILTALAARQVDAFMGLSSTDIALHKAGRLKILAVSSRARLPALPDVPTMAEAGLPEFDASTWFGLLLPKNTPPAVIASFENAMAEAMKDPGFRASLQNELMSELPPAATVTRAGFNRLIQSEVVRWQAIIPRKTE